MIDLTELDDDVARMFLGETSICSELSREQAERLAGDDDLTITREEPPEPPKPEPKLFDAIAHDFRRRWGLEK